MSYPANNLHRTFPVKGLFLTLLILGTVSALFAQGDTWTAWTRPMTTQDILAEEDILWVASLGGLVRIDRATGDREVWTTANSGLSNNNVSGVFRTADGSLWITHFHDSNLDGLDCGGISVLHPDGTWDVTLPSDIPGFNGNILHKAVSGADGNIWVSALHHGILKYDGSNWTQYHMNNSPLPSNDIMDFLVDDQGNVWAVCCETWFQSEMNYLGGGLARLASDPADWQVFDHHEILDDPQAPGISLKNMVQDSQGDFWFATAEVLWQFDGTNFIQHAPGPAVDTVGWLWDIAIDQNDTIYMNLILGAWGSFDGVNWQAHGQDFAPIGSEFIQNVYTDYDGSPLIATRDGGIWRWDGSDYEAIEIADPNNGMHMNEVHDITVDPTGDLWIGQGWYFGWNGSLGGLIQHRNGNWDTWGYDYMECFTVNDIAVQDNRSLCLATGCNQDVIMDLVGGVAIKDGVNWTVYNTMNSSYPFRFSNSADIDVWGNIWAAGNPMGLTVRESDGEWVWLNNENTPGLTTNQVFCIRADRNNHRVWLGTAAGLICITETVQGQREWEVYHPGNSPLPGGMIFDLKMKENGTLWIGCDGGYAGYAGDSWIVDDDFETERVYGIDEEEDGTLWIATLDEGLAKIEYGEVTWFNPDNSPLPTHYITEVAVSGTHVYATPYLSGVYNYPLGNTHAEDEHQWAPVAEAPHGCYPNPFNPETSLFFELPQNSRVKVGIYNVRGQLVKTLADGNLEAGKHTLVWNGNEENGSRAASGLYFYRIDTPNGSSTGKMTLMK